MIKGLTGAALIVLSLPSVLFAQTGSPWLDQQVLKKADLIAIAKVITTKDTTEQAELKNFTPAVHLSGVETEFETCYVIKGSKDIHKFRLRYFKPDQMIEIGPLFQIEIPRNKQPTYLLFLIKESDGRYAPVTGQTEIPGLSTSRLMAATGPRAGAPDPDVKCENDPGSSSGRHSWTYKKMFDEADVVAAGEWISTTETQERCALPGLEPHVPAIGVITEFRTALRLKGVEDIQEIALHSYKFQFEDDAFRMGAPQLVRIVPPVRRDDVYLPGGGLFLLFLKKEPDGRYAPVTGQIAPAVSSVLRLGW
jgi:hypothetical protein